MLRSCRSLPFGALLPLLTPLVLAGEQSCSSLRPIVIVGSLNVDITMRVPRPPKPEETMMASEPSTSVAVGGKGANQAVAAMRLSGADGKRAVRFLCQFGSDSHAKMLQDVLAAEGLDLSAAGHAKDLPSGQGIVMLADDGSATSVVVAGANSAWPEGASALRALASSALAGAAVVMLQREVPERVNAAVAAVARAAGVPVVLDAGGEATAVSPELLRDVSYIMPNEGELQRLTGMPTDSEQAILAAAGELRKAGPKVLVTLGERGSVLVGEEEGPVRQAAVPVPGGKVVDATAAGDSFRAAFAVAMAEGLPVRQGLAFAAAAGAVAVSRAGAVPSLPTRAESNALLAEEAQIPSAAGSCEAQASQEAADADECPLLFASRLNSMKARQDLWSSGQAGTLGLLARQGTVRGLGLVDFNHPQHLDGLHPAEVRAALQQVNMGCGAIGLRFPEEPFSRAGGAFTSPDAGVRQLALNITAEACSWASELGAGEVVIWPQYDGYDYQLQADYDTAWQAAVDTYRSAADLSACAGLRLSVEWKATDEASRFAFIPSTGEALRLVQAVGRRNFGLTLDIGHMLMAGENPAQSVAAAAREGALFGLHLNDGHSKLGAEDGLAFGSVHLTMALELVWWLRRVRYDGHIYFDTFPRNEDPVAEAEQNIATFKELWRRAGALQMSGAMSKRDALAALGAVQRVVGMAG